MIKAFNIEDFCEVLDTTRTERNLSWKDVSDLTGVPQSTLSKMQSGSVPTIDYFAALVKWAGLDANEFFSGSTSIPETLALIKLAILKDKVLLPPQKTALMQIFAASYKAFTSYLE